jgi:hypothetical protein
MYESALPLFLALIMLPAIYAEGIGFVILKPTHEELRAVHLSSSIQIEVAPWVNSGFQVPPQLVICTAEVLPEFDYGGGKKICIGATNFYMSGLRTGSNLFNITLESGPLDSDSRMVLASQTLLVDAVDAVAQRTDAERSQLARELPMIAPTLRPHDYCYYSNPGEAAAPAASDFTVLAAMESSSAPTAGIVSGGDHSVIVSTDLAMEEGILPPLLPRVRVALWARIAPQFVPSDRFLDWICDHAYLAAQGLDVTVIAPATRRTPCCHGCVLTSWRVPV